MISQTFVCAFVGFPNVAKALLVPMATGMTLSLCLTTLKQRRLQAKYVLWSRIDQKSCFKSILAASLQPIIIDTVRNPTTNGLETDLNAFEENIQELGAENIVCLFSTTSCFAPRQSDDILALAKLAAKHNIPHLINNAYGLQSGKLCNSIQKAGNGPDRRVDLFVQSTDKNLMVPVGGAIVCGFDANVVRAVSDCYAGRASSSQSLDVLMTLLSLGWCGYREFLDKRELAFCALRKGLLDICTYVAVDETFPKIQNPISVALPLGMLVEGRNVLEADINSIGSQLFTRGVSGSRFVKRHTTFDLEGYSFRGNFVHKFSII